MKDMLILKRLSEAFGPSSQEDEVLAIIREELGPEFQYHQTPHKNLVVVPRHEGYRKTVLFQAHMDELGFRPYRYLPSGFIELSPTCSMIPDCAGNQPLLFHPTGVRGILLTRTEGKRRRYYVDLGAGCAEEALKMVPRHSNGAFLAYPIEESPTQLMGKCFDDRAGCASIVRLLQEWRPDWPNRPVGVFTAREETGNWPVPELYRVIVGEGLHPDMIVNVELCPGGPTPTAGEPMAYVGQGIVLVHMDASYAPDSLICQFMEELAETKEIPHQYIAMRDGSGEMGKLALGFGCAGYPLTIPGRYMHCPRSVISKQDFKACIQMCREIAMTEELPI